MKLTIKVDLEREDGEHSAVLRQTIDDTNDITGVFATAAILAGKIGTEIFRLVYHKCSKTGWQPPVAEPGPREFKLPGDSRN